MTADKLIFKGCVVHCSEPFKLEIFDTGYVAVDGSKIVYIGSKAPDEKQYENYKCIELTKTQFLAPGLVDTHAHAPQYPNLGLGYDKPLLEWLQTYTFPLESRYKDVKFAKNVYKSVVSKTLSHGTTTVSYFATMHLDSSLALVDTIIEQGQRALVGKVNMINLAPENLCETCATNSLSDTEIFVVNVLNKNSDLVKPTITPRFALSCDVDLMTKLGALAKKYKLNIQSHISENQDEIAFTLKTFNTSSYAQVYDNSNLLTEKTIMAHAIHLTKEEIELFAKRSTSVAHCPNSNTCLQSGLCNVRELLSSNIHVGLGTDISGGHSPSIIEVMRSALQASIHLSYTNKSHKPLNFEDVFYLATLGGAAALSMSDKIGNFKKGKDFDAIVVDMGVSDCSVDLLLNYSPRELLQKFVYTADDRNILDVFVAGRRVKQHIEVNGNLIKNCH